MINCRSLLQYLIYSLSNQNFISKVFSKVLSCFSYKISATLYACISKSDLKTNISTCQVIASMPWNPSKLRMSQFINRLVENTFYVTTAWTRVYHVVEYSLCNSSPMFLFMHALSSKLLAFSNYGPFP